MKYQQRKIINQEVVPFPTTSRGTLTELYCHNRMDGQNTYYQRDTNYDGWNVYTADNMPKKRFQACEPCHEKKWTVSYFMHALIRDADFLLYHAVQASWGRL